MCMGVFAIRLKNYGLCGIEAVYSAHTAKETAYYKELAKELGLFVTGGSETNTEQVSRRIKTPAFFPEPSLTEKLEL